MNAGVAAVTGEGHVLVRWAVGHVEERLAAGGDRSRVLWSVLFTASVSTDSDAVLGAVVRALIAADEARWVASLASSSPAGGVR